MTRPAKKIIGYELFAVRRSGNAKKYRIVPKARVKLARLGLRLWINKQPTRYRMVCVPITE